MVGVTDVYKIWYFFFLGKWEERGRLVGERYMIDWCIRAEVSKGRYMVFYFFGVLRSWWRFLGSGIY